LPVEDPYLEDQLSLSLKKGEFSEFSQNLFLDEVPFSQTDNPVMAMVTFLSTVVSKDVAAAAAKSALEAFIKKRADGEVTKDTGNALPK
jgi:hypothetical protein